ncbi:MAG: T9SS type A sorting domain-containing protein [Flavobacteriales bacterium]
MKKVYLNVLGLLMGGALMAQTAVTFNVDMLPLGATDSLHVAGNFNDFNYDNVVDNAAYVNWTPNDPNALLTDADGDGVYSITMNLVPGRYEFKFINGNTWGSVETVPSACRVEVSGNDNRQIMVGADAQSYTVCYGSCALCGENAVRIRVDMSTVDLDLDGVFAEPGEDISPDGVHVNGDFVNWGTFVPLQDWNNDNVWETTLQVGNATNMIYKYINGADWALPNESISGACGDGTGNRSNAISTDNEVLPVYCWSSCDPCTQPVPVTFSVDMSASCADTSPGVNLMGTLTDWGTGAAMSDDNADGIWTITLNLAPGNYEYKFRIGSGGWEGIGNRQLAIVADTPTELPVVCFNSTEPCAPVVPPADVTFQAALGTSVLQPGQVVWVMGNFTNPNWQDGAIQMTDDNADGIWSVTVPQVCLQSLFYKYRVGTPGGADFTEESADFSAIGGCGVDNGTFSDNRVLTRATADAVTVCWTFDTCESCLPIGVEEENVVSGLSVYPVPADEMLNVNFTSAVPQRMVVRLMNTMGQIVVEENLGMVSGQRILNIPVADLAAGIYSLAISNGTSVQHVKVSIR